MAYTKKENPQSKNKVIDFEYVWKRVFAFSAFGLFGGSVIVGGIIGGIKLGMIGIFMGALIGTFAGGFSALAFAPLFAIAVAAVTMAVIRSKKTDVSSNYQNEQDDDPVLDKNIYAQIKDDSTEQKENLIDLKPVFIKIENKEEPTAQERLVNSLETVYVPDHSIFTSKENDTSNDEAIARLLQEEENLQLKK